MEEPKATSQEVMKKAIVCFWKEEKHKNTDTGEIEPTYDKNGHIKYERVGCGLLVSEKQILTCEHVVRECLSETMQLVLESGKVTSQVKEKIRISFPFSKATNNKYETKYIHLDKDNDVAIVKLLENIPVDVEPAQLYSLEETTLRSGEFEAYGFPVGNELGNWVSGEFSSSVEGGKIQINTTKGQLKIRKGFSGGGVWHTKRKCMVGIISATVLATDFAFFIPASIIKETWSELEILTEFDLEERDADLPKLPLGDLPNEPFRDLQYFKEKHAEIFFGRSREITECYRHLINPRVNPIILLHGQSGVGKSSFLDAGLLPRLKAGDGKRFFPHEVIYVRRDQEQGALNSLLKRLVNVDNEPVIKDSLKTFWHNLEEEIGKPLILVLDQLEEIYTRPYQIKNENDESEKPSQEEVNELKRSLEEVFGNSDQRPKGKIILSFRKEWLAEFEKQFKDLSYWDYFLEALDKEGIIETIENVSSNERLKSQYQLIIEDELAKTIAKDLSRDSDSNIAPTLQLLLTKMWDKARKGSSKVFFDNTLYENMRREGIFLRDFLNQRIEEVGKGHKEANDSGLIYDLLEYFTTKEGTADKRSYQDISKRYGHYQSLKELIKKLEEYHILTNLDDFENKVNKRLTHDVLAPFVRTKFYNSNKVGQRARRILESRDYQKDSIGSPMGKYDLRIVLGGKRGMRKWKGDEKENEVKLIEISKQHLQRNQLIEKIVSGSLTLGLIFVLFRVFTLWFIAVDVRSAQTYLSLALLLGVGLTLGHLVDLFSKDKITKMTSYIKVILGGLGFTFFSIIMSIWNIPKDYSSNPIPPTLGSLLVGLGFGVAIFSRQSYLPKKIGVIILAGLLCSLVHWHLIYTFEFTEGLVFAWDESYFEAPIAWDPHEKPISTYLSIFDAFLSGLIIIVGTSINLNLEIISNMFRGRKSNEAL